MSTRIGAMVQAGSGLRTDVYDGFSWPCFFFGSLWYLVKGMWGIGLAWFVLSCFTFSALHWVGVLVMPFFANRHYREHLASHGYANAPPG